MRRMTQKRTGVTAGDLMSPADVCHTLRIDKSTLSRWVAAGKIIPAQTIGHMRTFDRADVERIAQERAAS